MLKKWDIQITWNPWFSLGLHFDHTDPSITLHLPFIIIYVGYCKQPGFHTISTIEKNVGGDTELLDFLELQHELEYKSHIAGCYECEKINEMKDGVEINGRANWTKHSRTCWMIIIGRCGYDADTLRQAIRDTMDGLESDRKSLAEGDAARKAKEKK